MIPREWRVVRPGCAIVRGVCPHRPTHQIVRELEQPSGVLMIAQQLVNRHRLQGNCDHVWSESATVVYGDSGKLATATPPKIPAVLLYQSTNLRSRRRHE
jgi:hypothetical protein